MYEGEIAQGGFVVSGGEASGVLELVDAALDTVAQGIDEVVDGDTTRDTITLLTRDRAKIAA